MFRTKETSAIYDDDDDEEEVEDDDDATAEAKYNIYSLFTWC
jgi:hypothetical protein